MCLEESHARIAKTFSFSFGKVDSRNADTVLSTFTILLNTKFVMTKTVCSVLITEVVF